jgi:hypothetical protein
MTLRMSKEPEDFSPLLRLLAIKRHEQPSSDYFDQLSEEISSRIAAQMASPAIYGERAEENLGWMAQLWALLEARPALVGACGVAVSGMVLWGILSSPQTTAEAEMARSSTSAFSTPITMIPVTVAAVPTNATIGIDPQLPPGFFDTMYQRVTPTPVSLKQP